MKMFEGVILAWTEFDVHFPIDEILKQAQHSLFQNNGRPVVRAFSAYKSATSRENVSSGIFDQMRYKPVCSVTETS